LLFILGHGVNAQFPGAAGSATSTAIYKDSNIFVAWANSCSLKRGLMDLSNPSAGKTMLTFLIGRAQEQGFLNIQDTVSKHLGNGWTNMTTNQEKAITIWHQLTMTTGMDFTQPDCITPNCIQYRDAPGTFWYYYNPPYTLLRNVLESATSKSINSYMFTEVSLKTGISGTWIKTGTNNVLFSKARSMARFGSLILNNGQWDGQTILGDTSYMNASVNTSQNLNKSYGYLWWLNGKESFRLPQSTIQYNGPLMKDAPMDLYTGIGKNGQYVAIIPSQNMVIVRMGDDPDNNPVPTNFANEMFKKITQLSCTNSIPSVDNNNVFEVFPNPSNGIFSIRSATTQELELLSLDGQCLKTISVKRGSNNVSLSGLSSGMYIVKARNYLRKIYIDKSI
jgi:hypothetical protein